MSSSLEKKSFKQKWLNFILYFSNLIYKQKNSLLYCGLTQTFFRIIFIIIMEIFLSFISLPFYFFLTPDEDRLDFYSSVKAYRLRRKITLTILLSFLIFQVIGTIMTTFGFGLFYNYLIYGWIV